MGRFKTVFVPTTPNPTSGYFQLVPEECISGEEEIPMDEIVTMLLSAGVVTPEKLKVELDAKQEINKTSNEDAK